MHGKWRALSGLLLLSLWLIIAGTGIRANQEEPETELVTGSRLLEEGKAREALSLFDRFKQAHPVDPQPYFLAGMAKVQLQDWSGAATELKEAQRLDPGNPQTTILHANVLTRLGHNELAVNSLDMFKNEEALNSLPDAWAWLLSDTYYRAGSNDEALRVLEMLGRRDPENPRVYLNRGQVYYVKGDHPLAKKLISKSIEKKPEDNPVAYFELGKVLTQLGDPSAAKEAFLTAAAQDPGNPEYLWKLGAACLALGESKEALTYLEQAKAGADTYPEIYYSLGRAYQAEKERDKATEALKRFQEASNRDRQAQYRRIEGGKLVGKGEEELERGNAGAARSLFEEALKVDPDSWAAHGYLAELYLASRALYAAGKHIEKMRLLDPDHPTALFLSARYFYLMRDYSKALGYGTQVVETHPANAKLRNLMGNIYLALGKYASAVPEYEAAVRLAPKEEAYRKNLQAAKRHLLSHEQPGRMP